MSRRRKLQLQKLVTAHKLQTEEGIPENPRAALHRIPLPWRIMNPRSLPAMTMQRYSIEPTTRPQRPAAGHPSPLMHTPPPPL